MLRSCWYDGSATIDRFVIVGVLQLSNDLEFDYVRIGDEVLKAYTSRELRLLACVTNPTKAAFHVHSLRVTTQGYESVGGRVLRFVKPKGFIEPVKVTLRPSQNVGSGVELLDDKVLTIGSNAMGHATLLLDRATAPASTEWSSISPAERTVRP